MKITLPTTIVLVGVGGLLDNGEVVALDGYTALLDDHDHVRLQSVQGQLGHIVTGYGLGHSGARAIKQGNSGTYSCCTPLTYRKMYGKIVDKLRNKASLSQEKFLRYTHGRRAKNRTAGKP